MPGESSSVVTCLDGYQMARKGRAGAALGIAAIASFVAGTVGVIGLTLVAPPVAAFALSFSSPEYFALMCLGLALVVLLSGASLLKGLLSLLLGLWLTSIGTDLFTAQSRFIFGQATLLGGIDFMVVAIGVFAIGEVLGSVEAGDEAKVLPVPRGFRNLLPNAEELKACRFAFLNGSITGFLAAAPRSPRSSPMESRKQSRNIPSSSARARRKASRRPKAPTTPTPAAHLFHCSRSASRAAARPRSCCRRWCCGA
jgi:putative tricarboxylic transport membrane protein